MTKNVWKSKSVYCPFSAWLVAALLIQFSKENTFFHRLTPSFLKPAMSRVARAGLVLMSGVQVGTVAQTLLAPEGTNVSIYLKIYNQYVIRDVTPASSSSNQAFWGPVTWPFLPGENKGNILTNNSTIHAQEPSTCRKCPVGGRFIQRG